MNTKEILNDLVKYNILLLWSDFDPHLMTHTYCFVPPEAKQRKYL